MKKGFLLNGPVSRVVSLLGHGDSVCVSDAGLPIPHGVERIDLALHAGMPPLLETLLAVTSEMCVERAVIAEELEANQPAFYCKLLKEIRDLAREQGSEIPIEAVSHEEFKRLSGDCKAVLRSGECTPYANILLFAGVTF